MSTRQHQLIRLWNLLREAGHMRRLTESAKQEILKLETALQMQGN